ncbi:hypothetical protein DPMN_162939 [Dreissena polymorpha]|uniref:Uncharacterized protein n=1 Tax=Dreissena polymorpha TaxID=45954 RepID=A0A9D4IU47_DREPO|nr:hypothetical protein DPMN_162939 [Dreissena polymorpha]
MDINRSVEPLAQQPSDTWIIDHRSDQLLSCDVLSMGHDVISQHSDCEDFTDLEEVDFRDVQVLQSLVNLFKEYPRDMCVQRIVREYASS